MNLFRELFRYTVRGPYARSLGRVNEPAGHPMGITISANRTVQRNTVGIYLQKCREDADLTTEGVSDALGYKRRGTVSQWEHGAGKLPVNKWVAFAKLTKVDVNEFIARMLLGDHPDTYQAVFRDLPVTRAAEVIAAARSEGDLLSN